MSRALVEKYNKYLEKRKSDPQTAILSAPASAKLPAPAATHSIIMRMMQQVKLISQLITYTWLYDDPGDPNQEKASKIKYYFRHTVPDYKWHAEGSLSKKLFPDADPNQPKILADLMGADIDDKTVEGELLRAVFNPRPTSYQFPIFEKEAIENNFVGFEIDPGIFNGWITDPNPNTPSMLHVVIAFPPRPHLSEATVTKEELKAWLTNREDDDQFMSDNPYIPTCSS